MDFNNNLDEDPNEDFNLREVIHHFSAVAARVAAGQELTVTRHGKPVVVISAIQAQPDRARDRKAAKALLDLFRSCPVDLSRSVDRDKSAPRTTDIG